MAEPVDDEIDVDLPVVAVDADAVDEVDGATVVVVAVSSASEAVLVEARTVVAPVVALVPALFVAPLVAA